MKRNSTQAGPGGRLRLGLLLATAAAFLLVPAAHAAAAPPTLEVEIKGTGSGELSSAGGVVQGGVETGLGEGSPIIECSGSEPGAGVCENEMEEFIPGLSWIVGVHPIPDPGSEFTGWEIAEGGGDGCSESEGYEFEGVFQCVVVAFSEGETRKLVGKFEDTTSHVTVEIDGTGAGEVVNTAFELLHTNPLIECKYESPGPAEGVCEAEAGEFLSLIGAAVRAIPAPGSEVTGWEIIEGIELEPENEFDCGPKETDVCSFGVESSGEDARVKVTIDLEPEEFALNLSTSGSGSGSLQCDTGSGAEACAAEYVEGTEVTVIPTAGTGSELVEFSGDCTGATCELTMDAEKTVDAQFDLKTYTLTTVAIEEGGTGSFECEVNAAPASCEGSYTHGDSVKVVASAGAESEVDSISGPGSCEVAEDRLSGMCEFTIEEDSTVEAIFVSQGIKDPHEVTVEGTVDLQTTLETENCDNVDLGPFVPSNEEEKYENNECVVTVTATGQKNELRAADETGGLGGTDETGHLTQEPTFGFTLNKALEVQGTGTTGGASPNPSGWLALSGPAIIQDYGTPVSLDTVTVGFRQFIEAFEPLHTGTYSKTITLTLEQTVL